jgi:hypothetical protein
MARSKARAKAKPQPRRRAKSVSARRTKPSARRNASRRPAAKAKPQLRRPIKQRFIASHLKDAVFEQGLRSYSAYRDLGVAAATAGLAQAHVIRMIPPCVPAVVSKEHYHDVEFQLIYVLKGWFKGEYEGAGVVTMEEGSCWIQPPRIKHTVLDYSDDCELLEIILPAEFDTVET